MKELILLFLKLGATAFGGPAAHIAMIEEEVVRRRSWITHDEFLDLLGATYLIPGPNSTEMAIHIGYRRAGWRGLLAAGVCFTLPAVFITMFLARFYTLYGSLPQLQPFVSGIHPAIIAIMVGAITRLGKPVLKSRFSSVLCVFVLLLSLAGIDEVLLLVLAGAFGLLWSLRGKLRQSTMALVALIPLISVQVAGSPATTAVHASLAGIGLFFLKVGSVLYGSGYVLVAYLQGGLVDTRHWITQTQLFDAIAVGQITPGPVLSTATFVGYLMLGVPGALVATIGIFLPSFFFVFAINPLIPKMRKSPLAGGFLDGVSAASVSLMLAVAIKLALAGLTGFGEWIIFLAAAIAVAVWKINAAWIVIASAILGWVILR